MDSLEIQWRILAGRLQAKYKDATNSHAEPGKDPSSFENGLMAPRFHARLSRFINDRSGRNMAWL